MELNSDADPCDVTLDVDFSDTGSWLHRPFPIQDRGQRNLVQVVFHRSALDLLQQHGRSRMDVEICGVLVGGCYRDERGPYIYVETVIRGEFAENQLAQVTFTARTWNHIQSELERNHAGKLILGWYHTHPGFGIFLSAMDLFIHENFFNSSEQLALVYDPVAEEDGLFVWQAGQATRHSYLVVEAGRSRPEKKGNSPEDLSMKAHAVGELQDLPARLRRLEQRQTRLSLGLIVISAVAVAWPLLANWWGLPSSSPKEPLNLNPAASPDSKDPAENVPRGPVHKRSGQEPPPLPDSSVRPQEWDFAPVPAIPFEQLEIDQDPPTLDSEPARRMESGNPSPHRAAHHELEL